MKSERMYAERKANIPVFRGCNYHCVYCEFGKMLKMSSCLDCKAFKPHSHMEVLQRTPPKTKDGEFLTIGLSSDISFMEGEDFDKVLDYCRKWDDRTFLIQSKNPAYFLQFAHRITENIIIGTTIESNIGAWWYKEPHPFQHLIPEGQVQIHYNNSISKAPLPIDRYEAMIKLNCRKAITIEPILDFDWITTGEFLNWIQKIKPEIIWIGYDSGDHKLPEPALEKTKTFIHNLKICGFDVREKLLRKAWWEQ